jgi:hypothetical protein
MVGLVPIIQSQLAPARAESWLLGTSPRTTRVVDAEREQRTKLAGLEQPRRQPDLVKRAPEAVSATGVVVANFERFPAAVPTNTTWRLGARRLGSL